jgi:hypothetical protein
MKRQTIIADSGVNNWSLFRLGLLSTAHVVLTIMFISTAPQFYQIYRSFGTLPLFSKIFAQSFPFVGAFLIVCGLVQLGLFIHVVATRAFTSQRRVRIFGLTNIALIALLMIILYLPAFTLGAAV